MRTKRLLLSVLPLLAAQMAQGQGADVLTYTVNDAAAHTVTASGFSGQGDSLLVIPETVDIGGTAYTVDCIDLEASMWLGGGGNVAHVVVPKTVTTIRNLRLANYGPATHKVEFATGSALRTIADEAFSGNYMMTDIQLPGRLDSIGAGAFDGCPLNEVTLPASVVYVGAGAFPSVAAVYPLGDVPPEVDYDYMDPAFRADAVVYVPIGRIEAYASDDSWGRFTVGGIPVRVDYISYMPTSTTTACVVGNTVADGGRMVVEASVEAEGYSLAVTSIDADALSGLPSELVVKAPVAYLRSQSFVRYADGEWTSRLERVELPATLEKIADGQFEYCAGLRELDLPDGVAYIGNYAFRGCTGLERIDLGESLRQLGYSAFEGCTSLEGVRLPSGLREISFSTFEGAASLASVEIPEGVTSIGRSAFEGCARLADVKLPESLVSVGQAAFSGCSSLRGIALPGELAEIGGSAFAYSGLETVALPEAFRTNAGLELDAMAFYNCQSLKNITVAGDGESANYFDEDGVLMRHQADGDWLVLYPVGREDATYDVPAGICGIGDYAFANDSSLATVGLPEGLRYVSGFSLSTISRISLPSTVEEIGYLAFWYAPISDVNIPKGVRKIGQGAFSMTKLRSVSLPDSLVEVGIRAFYNVPIAEVTIPAKVALIDDYAFQGCPLDRVYASPTTPPNLGLDAFTAPGATLYVRSGSVEDYRETIDYGLWYGWGNYFTNLVSLSDAEMDRVTGIDGVAADARPGDGAYYTLGGVRVENPSKGIYIRNGRKVVVK